MLPVQRRSLLGQRASLSLLLGREYGLLLAQDRLLHPGLARLAEDAQNKEP